MELAQKIIIDEDEFFLHVTETGHYKYICEKNKRGFKTTFTPSQDEVKYKMADEAMERFIVNNLL